MGIQLNLALGLGGLLGAVGNTVAGVVDGITGVIGGTGNSGGTSGESGTGGTSGEGTVVKSALAIAPVPAAVVGAVLLGSKARTRSGKKMRKG